MAKKQQFFMPGFSLLEVSISLFIIGIISAISVSQLAAVKKMCAVQKTQANIDFIVRSLGVYCTQHHDGDKLPPPSDFSNEIGIGSETMHGTFGIVPFKTLRIMERFAKDSNGGWLLYRMNPHFLSRENISDSQRSLDINEFVSITKDGRKDKVAFIIKSVSKDGKDDIVIWYSEENFKENFIKERLVNEQIGSVTVKEPMAEKSETVKLAPRAQQPTPQAPPTPLASVGGGTGERRSFSRRRTD